MKRIFQKRGGCEEAEILIQRSLDAPLSTAERHRLDQHLATCESCKKAWDEYRRLSRTASQWMHASAEDPGDDFTQRVMAELGLSAAPEPSGMPAQPRSATRPPRQVAWGVSIAVVAALVVLGIFLPPITHFRTDLEGYAPSMGALPTSTSISQWWQFNRPEYGETLSLLRSWTWPMYAFVGALAANIVFAGIMLRHRRRVV